MFSKFVDFSLSLLIVGILTISASASPWVADDGASAPEPAVSADQLRTWLDDLGSDDYSRRQYANHQIGRHQHAALPIVIEALATSMGEKVERLLLMLAGLASDPYSAEGVKAFDALQKLANEQTTAKGFRAKKILNAIEEDQKEQTLEQLRAIGAEPRTGSFQIISKRVPVNNALVLDSNFSGDEILLERLRWLDHVEFVRLEGTATQTVFLEYVFKLPNLKRLQLVNCKLRAEDILSFDAAPDLDHLEFIYASFGDEAVQAIERIPVWDTLYLFGTKLTQSGGRELKAKMEGIDVIVAKGGFLGVECPETSVKISGVVQGGAADLANLQPQDRILRVNGINVLVFEDLRKELANFGEGESVEIEFQRRGSIQRTTAVLQKRPDQPRVR